MDLVKNYLCSGAYIGFLKGGQMFAGHTKRPNMFSCFSTVKQKQKQKNKIVSVDQGAPFSGGVGGPGCNRTPAPWGQSTTDCLSRVVGNGQTSQMKNSKN